MLLSRLVLLFTFACISSCTTFYRSYTPEGVDVSPILAVELSQPVGKIETLTEVMPEGFSLTKELGADVIGYYFPDIEEKDKYRIYHHFAIYRFTNDQGADTRYINYKHTFTDRSDNWKLFREEDGAGGIYFLSYRAPRMDYTHGIPSAVISKPEIIVVVKKRNLLISMSFTSYRSDVDYVGAINKDIAYTADLLKKALARMSAARSRQ